MVANPPVITLLISDLKEVKDEGLSDCDISLLGHGRKERSDEQGSLSLTQENVCSSVHRLGCRGAHRDVKEPTW